MATGLLIFSNLIVPLITGLFFLLYFAYFVIANPSKAPSYRYFIVFLVGFSIFLFGRPLQLLLGPHPLPLIIVNIRVFILCSVISPAIILAAEVSNRNRGRRFRAAVVAVCILLGVTYDVFNTLGTSESYRLFEFASMTAFDNLTPSGTPPFFGREVTIGVQIVTGGILLLFSFLELLRLRVETTVSELLRNKTFLINVGILVFALSFIVGSLAKQWWVYYATSVVSALLFGASVLIDVKELHYYYEKLVPFIKEDIIHNVAFSEFSKIKLMEMLRCLGKRTNLNTFIVVKLREERLHLSYDLELTEQVLGVFDRRLEAILSGESFLLIPLSDEKLGIVVRLPKQEDRSQSSILEVLEDVQIEISAKFKCSSAIGIGRSYDRMEELRVSYYEALNAQEYAEKLDGNSIIHVENINERAEHRSRYPVKEKELLLSVVKLGDVENGTKALAEFFEKFRPFIEEKPEVLKARLYEMVGAIIDSAILGGGDEGRLNELIVKYVNDVGFVDDLDTAEKWLQNVVAETAGSVVHVYERRSKVLIEKARLFVDEHFPEQLSYKDVAKEVFISPSYFLYLFKRETGTTFVDYLTAVRVGEAKKLLLSSDRSITEIAFAVGFNSSNYFSVLFRKTVGVTPKDYRSGNPDGQTPGVAAGEPRQA